MITINLRPGQKRARAGKGVPLAQRLRGLTAGIKEPLSLVSIGVWVLLVGWLGWTWFSTSRSLSALEPKFTQAVSEHRRYKGFLAERRREEVIRDSLVSQIRTIRGVDGDRYIWPHILDEVSRALPPFTWLTEMKVLPQALDTLGNAPPTKIELTGRTVDIQGYTRFLRQLEDSPWLGNVQAMSAKTVVDRERAVTEFIIQSTFTQADSSFIRTVPVRESVVR